MRLARNPNVGRRIVTVSKARNADPSRTSGHERHTEHTQATNETKTKTRKGRHKSKSTHTTTQPHNEHARQPARAEPFNHAPHVARPSPAAAPGRTPAGRPVRATARASHAAGPARQRRACQQRRAGRCGGGQLHAQQRCPTSDAAVPSGTSEPQPQCGNPSAATPPPRQP